MGPGRVRRIEDSPAGPGGIDPQGSRSYHPRGQAGQQHEGQSGRALGRGAPGDSREGDLKEETTSETSWSSLTRQAIGERLMSNSRGFLAAAGGLGLAG